MGGWLPPETLTASAIAKYSKIDIGVMIMATYRVQRVIVFRADIEADSIEEAVEFFSESAAIQNGAVYTNPKNPNSMGDEFHIDQGDAIKLVKEDGSLSSKTWRN